jgi:hypothetical protein
METLLLTTTVIALALLVSGVAGLVAAMLNIRGRIRGLWRL